MTEHEAAGSTQEPTKPDRTPAATLTAAAEKLRGLVDDLGDCRGPWYVVNRNQHPYPQRIDNIGVPYVVASTTTDPAQAPTIADYIVAMHPGIGAALADLLEATVDRRARLESLFGDLPALTNDPALALARQVLGPTS